MRENISQQYNVAEDGRIYFEGDWYGKGLPGNVNLGKNFYFSSSQGFERIYSKKENALTIGDEVGLYDQFGFEIGKNGSVTVGDFSIINSSRLRCVKHISIGKFCMVSWGTFITDSWVDENNLDLRKYHRNKSLDDVQPLGFVSPIVVEDNVWIGFGCVIMPGVTIGKGSIVSSKTIVDKSVPAYTVVGGSPMRELKKLEDK